MVEGRVLLGRICGTSIRLSKPQTQSYFIRYQIVPVARPPRPKADFSALNAFFQEICRSGFPLRRLITLTPPDMFLVSWFLFLSWSFCAKSWNSLSSIIFRLFSSINLSSFRVVCFSNNRLPPDSANRLSAYINAGLPFLRIRIFFPITYWYWYTFLLIWNEKMGIKPDNGHRSLRG